MTDATESSEANTPQTWVELLESHEQFPSIIARLMQLMGRLLVYTHLKEDDHLGNLILGFMVSSRMDADDLMTLSHRDSHHGAQYPLRVLFERTVTLKYLSRNPDQVQKFLNYDAVDWFQILNGINSLTGMTVSEPAWSNINTRATAARKENKQEKCSVCHYQKPTSWTTLNTKDMAEKVGLGHLYLNCYLFPSKLMHPTLWGTHERVKHNNPMYNTMKCLHHLLIETILIHRRHFIGIHGKPYVTPMMTSALQRFLDIWVFSETSFDGVLTRGQEREGKWIYY